MSLVYLGIAIIQHGKSFLKFDCWLKKVFKKYEHIIQIMMSLFFLPINPRSTIRSFSRNVMQWIPHMMFLSRSIIRWIQNIKSLILDIFKVIFFKNNLIWPFQLLVRIISLLGLLKRSIWPYICAASWRCLLVQCSSLSFSSQNFRYIIPFFFGLCALSYFGWYDKK